MIHIDNATNEQLSFACGIAQGWELLPVQHGYSEQTFKIQDDWVVLISNYKPTESCNVGKIQCSDLINKYGISTRFNGMWDAYCGNAQERIGQNTNESRLVAAVKAFLWSVYPDGMIPVIADVKND